MCPARRLRQRITNNTGSRPCTLQTTNPQYVRRRDFNTITTEKTPLIVTSEYHCRRSLAIIGYLRALQRSHTRGCGDSTTIPNWRNNDAFHRSANPEGGYFEACRFTAFHFSRLIAWWRWRSGFWRFVNPHRLLFMALAFAFFFYICAGCFSGYRPSATDAIVRGSTSSVGKSGGVELGLALLFVQFFFCAPQL